MFSIGEFARLGGVSARTLRHYDEIGLLRPVTVDPNTAYRGYAAAQLGQLNRIMALKELGLSLTQVRRLLDGVTLDELRGMLALRRAQLEQELEQHTGGPSRAGAVPGAAGNRGGRRGAQRPRGDHFPNGVPRPGPMDRGAGLPPRRTKP